MTRIAFTGAAGPAASAVTARVAENVGRDGVVVLSPRPVVESSVETHAVDVGSVDLDRFFSGTDAVVHLGAPVDGIDPYRLAPGRLVQEACAVIDAARRCGVGHVIVVSSALVLGAEPSNPVPLTEQAVVHPAPGFRPAVEMAEIERIVAHQRTGSPTFTVLRAAPVVADGAPGWLAAELHTSLAYPVEGRDPGLQYLHAEDLGDAVVTVLDAAFDGLVNVAPDGALSGPQRRALESRPWLRVSDRVAHLTASVRAAAGGTGAPEGIRPYLVEEWSLANDRLRGLGWEPVHTDETAYVAAFRPAPWSMIPSGRRQELLLGGVGALLVGGLVGTGLVLRRRHR